MSIVLIKQILTGKFKLYYKANMRKAMQYLSFINCSILIILQYSLHCYFSKLCNNKKHQLTNNQYTKLIVSTT